MSSLRTSALESHCSRLISEAVLEELEDAEEQNKTQNTAWNSHCNSVTIC